MSRGRLGPSCVRWSAGEAEWTRPRDRFDLDLIAKRLSKTVRTNDQGEHVFSQPSGVFVLEELASVLDTASSSSRPEFSRCASGIEASRKQCSQPLVLAQPAERLLSPLSLDGNRPTCARNQKTSRSWCSLSMALSQDGVRWHSFRGCAIPAITTCRPAPTATKACAQALERQERSVRRRLTRSLPSR